MRAVRSTNTRPEMAVRSMIFREGYRFRLHRRDLPGRPDIVFPSAKKAIFVNGCFWHFHKNCAVAHYPKNDSTGFWRAKLDRNTERDRQANVDLKKLGWKT